MLRGTTGPGVGVVPLPDAQCAELGLPVGCTGHELTDHQLDLVDGLAALLGEHVTPLRTSNQGNDILIGGAGSDLLEGRGGDDFIDGDAWLDVALVHHGSRFDRMSDLRAGVFADPPTVGPGDVTISRRIVDEPDGALDTAVFSA